MNLAIAWLLFPLVLGLLSLGCGLLLETVSGLQFPRALLMPLGFALIVVVSLGTTSYARTAHLTTAVVVALAVAGLVLALPRRLARRGGWAAASALLTYAVYGAPVFLSGSATFAGYIALDDTATWLGISDRLLEHGRNTTGLPLSSYEAALSIYLNQGGYPVGAFTPLGIVHELLGTDSAWLFQPYIAFLGAMLALGLYGLTTRTIGAPPLRAVAAFVAAQPALLYGYSLWGGVKEMTSAGLVVLVAALTPLALREGVRVRSLLPLAVATAALIGVLSFDGGVWIGPIFVLALVAGVRLRKLAIVRIVAAIAAFTLVLSIPTIRLIGRFSSTTSGLTLNDLGNLIRPLDKLQVIGIWPAGDFRIRPHTMSLTYVLIGAVAAAALVGLWWAWRRGEWGLLLYVAGAAVGCAVSVALGSPWIDGKALAIASPAALITAFAAVGWLLQSRRRLETVVAVLIVAGGVFWSNALAYHQVWLAPRSQLAELETIGKQFAGDGPALTNEYSPYGARHFLRHVAPESASELRRRFDFLRNGEQVPKGGYADIDQFQLAGLLVYRTLVLPRTPSASRPPSIYRLVWHGSFYDVWQRPLTASRIIEHVPLGIDPQPAATAPCATVLRLGRLAAAHSGRLAVVTRPPVSVVDLASAGHPADWQAATDVAGAVYPDSPGDLQATVQVAASARYGFWIAGSFRRQIDLSVDGTHVASAGNHLANPGVDTPLGQVTLDAGIHHIVLHYGDADLRPGSGGAPFAFGPLVVSRSTAELPVTYVQPSHARSLCGRRLDWIEAVDR